MRFLELQKILQIRESGNAMVNALGRSTYLYNQKATLLCPGSLDILNFWGPTYIHESGCTYDLKLSSNTFLLTEFEYGL